ncbi:MAG: DNA polymerase Y family protein [Armatimonadota bacterium]|nr:DNA polymerase Y family protein [Armatimonadota bacterium]
MRHRYASLVVPSFSAAAILRSRPELRHHPLAVVAGRSPALTIVDANASARRAGVRPLMAVAEAQARAPGLTLVARSPVCEASAQAALLDVALGVSPRVEDGGAGAVCLDATGFGLLYRDERRVAEDLAARAEAAGLPASVAIASTRTAAQLAASVRPLTVIRPGGEADALAPLPLTLLALSDDLSAVLTRWGIRTLGEVAALPDAALIERLGVEGRRVQRRARGEDLGPLVPYRPPAVVEEAVDLEWPIDNLEALAFVLSGVLDRLVARLAGRGWALGAVHLTLGLADQSAKAFPLSPASPLTDSRAILPLLLQTIRSAPPPAAIARVAVRAEPAVQRMAQAALFSPSLVSPEQLAATLARLEALVGRDNVGSPELLDTHRPDAFVTKPFERLPSHPARSSSPLAGEGCGRGNTGPVLRRVRPPVAVEVGTTPDGLPTRILGGPWQNDVCVASGPWRSCGEWWSETAWSIEEWDVETAGRAVVRLAFDRLTRQWSVEGVYD